MRDASNLPTPCGRSGLVEVPLDLPGWCLRFLFSSLFLPAGESGDPFGGRRRFGFDRVPVVRSVAHCTSNLALPIVDDRCQGCRLCYCKFSMAPRPAFDCLFVDFQNYDFPNNCEDYVHRIGRTGVSILPSCYRLSADVFHSEPVRRVSLTPTSPRTMPSRLESSLVSCVRPSRSSRLSLRRW